MSKLPANIHQYFYSVLRIVTGFLYLWHGSNKVIGFPKAAGDAPFHITWIAGPLELFGGILIMIGLFTRPSAFISAGLMAVAYWWVHGMKAFLPIVNHGELAVIYCFIFLYIFARGAGIWSVDSIIHQKHIAKTEE